jgi:circadian clock protein KaiC
VESENARIVIIDSLVGYLNAMPSEHFLTLHLHELLSYLSQQGVTSLLIMTQHGFFNSETPIDASYLADTVLYLRYYEAFGEIRQAISVIKKRTGRHERTVRDLRMNGGIQIGRPLRDFRGVLSGDPEYLGASQPEQE